MLSGFENKLLKQIFEIDIVAAPRSLVRKIFLYSFLRVVNNFLDLFGVALVAFLVGSISGGVYLQIPFVDPPSFLTGRIEEKTIIALAALAACSFALRSIFGMALVWQTSRFAAKIEATYGANTFGAWLGRKPSLRQADKEALQQVFTESSMARIFSILITKISLVGEISLFVILGTAMIIASPLIGVVVLVFVGVLGLIMSRLVLKRVIKSQKTVQEERLKTLAFVDDTFELQGEITAGRYDSQNYFKETMFELRIQQSLEHAKLAAYSAAPRYIIELAAVLGVVILLSAVSLATNLSEVAGQVGFAIATAFRLSTSLLPIQSALQNLQRSRAIAANVTEAFDTDIDGKTYRPDGQMSLEVRAQTLIIKEQEGFLSEDKQYRIHHDIELSPKTWTAVTGSSGVGKTRWIGALLNNIVSLEQELEFRVGYSSQSPRIIGANVYEDLLLKRTASSSEMSLVDSLTARLGIEDLWDKTTESLSSGSTRRSLSGGEELKVGIARALAQNPELLILDEPTAALDSESVKKVIGTILEFHNGPVILVSHDRRLIEACHNRIVVVDQGLFLSISNEL